MCPIFGNTLFGRASRAEWGGGGEWLIKESGYEAQRSLLCYVFVTVLSLDGAQKTIGFEFCMSS